MSRKTSGQSLLVILLVMAVILTIGLAVASYSITDIKISQQEEESARAFSAAEAGIEESLKLGIATSTTIEGITNSVTGDPQGEDINFDFGGSKFPSGELANVWLIGHDNDNQPDESITPFPRTGQIKLCWGDKGAASSPALELALVYKNSSDEYKVIRQGYEPNESRINGFDTTGITEGGNENCPSGLAFAKLINLDQVPFGLINDDQPYLLRLKLLYNENEAQSIAVQASSALPNQGNCYDSSASIQSSGVTRKIRQCQFHQAPPEIFDYVLFSTSGIVK